MRDNSNLITENFATKHRQRIWERNDVVKIIFTFGNVYYNINSAFSIQSCRSCYAYTTSVNAHFTRFL